MVVESLQMNTSLKKPLIGTVFCGQTRELFSHSSSQYVWRKKDETFKAKNTIPTMKHGGSSLVFWGCFSTKNVGALVRVNGKMKREDFCDILEETLKRSGRNLGMRRR